jgi:hypothetical protein
MPINDAQFDPTGAMTGSDFLYHVREQFFEDDGSPKWPGDPEDSAETRAAWEIPLALNVLYRRVRFDEDLPEAPAETALGKLKAAADAVQWPSAASAIPPSWSPPETRTVDSYRMYEVACAVNLMLRAVNSSGGGGGPREYPPPPDNV